MSKSFEARFESFVEKHELFQKKDKLLLAISGGGDSVCLFHLLRLQGYNFQCAHVNYKLRGDESDGDQKFVEEICDQYSVKLHVLKNDLSFLKNENGNLQEVARQKRYEFFKQLILEHSFDKVMTAHTKTDDIETMLQMMARSSSIRGISGIPYKRENISRPLLFATTKEIQSWLYQQRFQFRTDSSNESKNYTRNRLRREVLPALESIYPRFQSQAGQSLLLLKEYHRFFQHQFETIKKNLVTSKIGYSSIDETKLKKTGFAELLLFELLHPYGFNGDQCSDILSSSQKGLKFLSDEYELITDNDAYCFRKRRPNNVVISLKIEKPGEYVFSEGTLSIFDKTIRTTEFQKDNLTIYLNPNKVGYPMLLRSWIDGDRISPFGMNGKTKKVKDILRDKRLNLFEKEKILVLEINGDICWIPGICINHNYRLKENSDKAVFVKFTPCHQTMGQH